MHDRRIFLGSISSASLLFVLGCTTVRSGVGFSGNPIMEDLPGQRRKLLKTLEFEDPTGGLWIVPKGYISDGASIPKILWSFAGGSWSDDYSDAAIVHDRYCDTMERSWEATHRVFYDAMRSRGLSASAATKKYWAVYKFGPRWDGNYRWTSFLRLNVKPRHAGVGGAPPPAAPPAPMPARAPAAALPSIGLSVPALLTEQEFLELQRSQFASAAAQIDAQNLGPEDVPNLLP